MKSQYREEIEATRHRLDVLDAELDRIDQAIQDKSGVPRQTRRLPQGRTATNNGKGRREDPALREMILRVMKQRPGPWTTREVYDALDKIGVAPKGKKPVNTVGNRLLELAAGEHVKRVGRGVYEFPNASKGMDRNRLFTGSAIQEAESKGA